MTRRDRIKRREAFRDGCFGKGRSNVGAGIIILLVGAALLAREAGVLFPKWFFTWPMIVMAVGLFVGVTNRFRDFGWILIVGVGFFFLADDIWPDISFRNYLFPIIFITIGLFIIFKPRSSVNMFNWGSKKSEDEPLVSSTGTTSIDPDQDQTSSSADSVKADVLDIAAIFGAVKKNVVSKEFRGGEIVTVFGGADINLTQADFKQPQIIIESVSIFGGVKLIVPSNWQIRTEAVAIFGGIEDKRPQFGLEPEKILVIEGFVMFGGIEIKSF
jgi:predicted membrane protein